MQIVFLHIQKTAGTALFEALSSYFEPSQTYWGPNPPFNDPNLQLAASHLPLRDHVFTDGRPRLLITAIRDPFERLISLYRYWRSMRWSMVARNPSPHIAKAKQMDLVAWLRDPEVIAAVDNGMVAHFCDDPNAPPQARVNQAKANLAKTHFIATAQFLTEDVHQLFNALGLDPVSPAFVNGTDANAASHPDVFEAVEPIEMTDAVFEALTERTSLDRELYDFGLSIRGEINGRLNAVAARSPPKIKLRRLDEGTSLLARGLRAEPTMLGNGWAPVEEWHVWTAQPSANLFFATTAEARSCELKIEAHLPGGRETLKVRITVNNTIAMDMMFVGASTTHLFDVAKHAHPILLCSGTAPVLVQMPLDVGRSADGRVDIRFEIENLLSPAQLGLNQDARLLGLALYSLRCSATPAHNAEEWRRLDGAGA